LDKPSCAWADVDHVFPPFRFVTVCLHDDDRVGMPEIGAFG
jgi:hypothetical protein